MSSKSAYGEVYSIHLNVIQFVRDFLQVGGFNGTPVSSTNTINWHTIADVFVKVALNVITLNLLIDLLPKNC